MLMVANDLLRLVIGSDAMHVCLLAVTCQRILKHPSARPT